MFLFKSKPEQPSYKETKEYLDKQQKIDYLLVLTKLLEPGMNIESDTVKLVNRKIPSIIEELK